MTPQNSPEMTGPTPNSQPESPSPAALAGLDERELLARGLEQDTRSATGSWRWEPPSPETLGNLLPEFEILGLIGRGGMGAVYRARQKKLDRLVALKVLPEEAADSPEFAERFAREARTLARLSHPHIVAIHDFGNRGELFYLVMELVDGVNLRQAIRSRSLEPEQALRIVPQICEALQFAHSQGVLHRDIKPENILLDRCGQVKIADFGIAKLIDPGKPGHTLTATDRLLGTLTYMAPEQVEGSRNVDHRADIYSLGVVFYEMLTGELPLGRFPKPSQRVQIDLRLDEVVLRSLEKEPALRYQQAGEIKSDVEHITQAPAPAPAPPALRPEQLAAAASPSSPGHGATELVSPTSPALQPAMSPRFSRKAIAGALCGVLGFLLVAGVIVPMFTVTHVVSVTPAGVAPAPNASPTILVFPILLFAAVIGLSAPLVATILGLMSISDIRHSQGRITGLPLALFDALLFPLLVLDIVLFVLWIMGLRWVMHMTSPGHVLIPLAWNVFPAACLCLIVDIVIVMLAWKAAVKPPQPALS